MNEIKNNWKKWIYWFLLGVAIIIVYKALDNFANVIEGTKRILNIVTPFMAGAFIAYLLFIPCKKIEEVFLKSKLKILSKKSKTFSILVVYLIIILIIVILTNVILPVVFEGVTDLINNAQNYYELAINEYNSLADDSVFKSEWINDIVQDVQQIDIKQYFALDRIFEYVISAVNAVTGIFDVFVAVIVSIYILSEKDKILVSLRKITKAMFKESTYENIDKYCNTSNKIFFKFVTSQFLDSIIVGILVTIAMSMMGIKYAPVLGFLIGLSNMIPYIGAIISIGIAGIITLMTGGIAQTVWMLIVVIILQQIDANIINPKIVGQSLEISPLLVIFSVTIGGACFGILGMFLAVPIMTVIKMIIGDYIEYKLKKKDIDKKQQIIK